MHIFEILFILSDGFEDMDIFILVLMGGGSPGVEFHGHNSFQKVWFKKLIFVVGHFKVEYIIKGGGGGKKITSGVLHKSKWIVINELLTEITPFNLSSE